MNPLLLTLFICICILTALLILKLLDMRRSIRRIEESFLKSSPQTLIHRSPSPAAAR